MGFVLSDFTNKREFINKINGKGQTSGYVLKTNGSSSYWGPDSGGGGGSSIDDIKRSESGEQGYFAGSITVDNNLYEFNVSPARITFDKDVSWQGVIRPSFEIDLTESETTMFDRGISRSMPTGMSVATQFNIGRIDTVLIPISCVYHYNAYTNRFESIPCLVLPLSSFLNTEGMSTLYGEPERVQ